MACQGCIGRQERLVRLACKKPDSYLCRKARERLSRMKASGTTSVPSNKPHGKVET